MRQLVYYVATTLDGFIAGPDGDLSDERVFPLPDDLVQYIVAELPETLPGPARHAMGVDAPGRRFDTVVEGRGSYEVGLAAGITNAYPHLRHIVVSTTLGECPDPTVELFDGDPLDLVRDLKAEEGLDVWIVGGGKLAHSLLPEIDRVILKQHASVIGSGTPLFNGPFAPHRFRPAETCELDSGVRILTFERG